MGKSGADDDEKAWSRCRCIGWLFVRHRWIWWTVSSEYRYDTRVYIRSSPGNTFLIFLPLSVERYDPRQNKWCSMSPMSTRRKHLGCAVFNNLIYAVGGRDDCMELSSAERYNPHTNSWSPIVAMTSRRSGVSIWKWNGDRIYVVCDGLSLSLSQVGLAVVNGQLYAVGGFDGTAYLKSIEVYDPEQNQWRLCGSMN